MVQLLHNRMNLYILFQVVLLSFDYEIEFREIEKKLELFENSSKIILVEIHCPDKSIRPLPNIHVLIVPCID